MSAVPQIDSDSQAVAPDYAHYITNDGEYVRVASANELGIRKIQQLIKLGRSIQPIMQMLMTFDSDEEAEELTDEEFEDCLEAGRNFVRLTSEMDDEQLSDMGEMELVGYVAGFLGELTGSIGASNKLRFR